MLEEDFFQVGLFSIRVGLFLARGGLFSIGVGLFLVGGGLFLSPTVAEKSPTPAEKSPTAILKRCWTLEYFGELEFSSPFMEQWTLDARGVLYSNWTMISYCLSQSKSAFTSLDNDLVECGLKKVFKSWPVFQKLWGRPMPKMTRPGSGASCSLK